MLPGCVTSQLYKTVSEVQAWGWGQEGDGGCRCGRGLRGKWLQQVPCGPRSGALLWYLPHIWDVLLWVDGPWAQAPSPTSWVCPDKPCLVWWWVGCSVAGPAGEQPALHAGLLEGSVCVLCTCDPVSMCVSTCIHIYMCVAVTGRVCVHTRLPPGVHGCTCVYTCVTGYLRGTLKPPGRAGRGATGHRRTHRTLPAQLGELRAGPPGLSRAPHGPERPRAGGGPGSRVALT